MNRPVCSDSAVHAHYDEWRIDRYRTDGCCRHSTGLLVVIQGCNKDHPSRDIGQYSLECISGYHDSRFLCPLDFTHSTYVGST
jgi:hypothetical protein